MSDLKKVLIADDHMVVRRGLSSLLIPRNGMKVVGEASDGKEAVSLAQELQPDVILMDMVMPNQDGVNHRSFFIVRPISFKQNEMPYPVCIYSSDNWIYAIIVVFSCR